MPDLSFLKNAPYELDNHSISWVSERYARLSPQARLGQLFCLRTDLSQEATRAHLQQFQPGGIIPALGPDRDRERARLDQAQAAAAVPLLVAADLEGSRMSLPHGTPVPNPLALAAIDDTKVTTRLTRILAREARDIGVNWAYAPVLDINHAWRSAIVATRGFGAQPERILRHALAQIAAFQGNGIAATIKHWPGEGYDDRDQHLVTTINPQDMDAWRATFGKLYAACIDAGALSVMSAHIALPSYATAKGEEGIALYRPASISRHLNRELLRADLGFAGVITSDASEMAGVSGFVPAPQSKVEMLKGGCDMILMSSDPEGDLHAVAQALASGDLDAGETEMSVLRILGLKARLGLHRADTRGSVDYGAHRHAVDTEIRKAPTLVKDTQGLLPISPASHKRITIVSGGIVEPLRGATLPFVVPDLLQAEGFEVTQQQRGAAIDTQNTDLVLYLLADETLLTRGHIFLDWAGLTGDFRLAMQRTWHAVPTAMISFGYPYFLYGAPRMPTYINAYASMDDMQRAVVDLLLGRGAWNRTSPIDPFVGAPDARF